MPQQNLGSLSTTSSTPTPTPSPTPSPTPEPEPSSSGLGAGAIAGIAVAGVAVLALIIFAIWFMRRRKQKQAKQATETTPYTHVPREDISPVTQTRSTVGSMAFSDSTTAYALPSPRTDAWKQSWQSYSEPDASYAASNGYSNPRSPTGVPSAPVEMVSVVRLDELRDRLLTNPTPAWFEFVNVSKRIGRIQNLQSLIYASDCILLSLQSTHTGICLVVAAMSGR